MTDVPWLSDLPTTLEQASSITTTAFRVSVVEGPDAGQSLVIDEHAALPALIGTSEIANLRLRDPSVSRRHITLAVEGSNLRLRDLGSTNGTRLNGTRLTDALLVGHETIDLGQTTIAISRHHEVAAARPPVADLGSFGDYIGRSLAMRKLYPICQRLAQADVPLVIEGETGTGKEALAEAIHAQGPRAGKPFVVFDCTAVPGTLIESALFGHEKGAFTGAVSTQMGVFEEANGGTILIDEIGDLELALQAKLLRAIQSREIKRVGGTKWIKFDIRIIAATRRDLDREVQEGRFRDDLFFRLAIARIVLPALRDRREDIPLLAHHFWKLYSSGAPFPDDVLPKLQRHAWPGNVRELANTIARLSALGDCATAELFMQRTGGTGSLDFISEVVDQNLELPEARTLVLRELERRYVNHLLEVHQGDVKRAAAASGFGERYLRTIRARVR